MNGSKRDVRFLGCCEDAQDCDAGRFECRQDGRAVIIKVRVTAQIERILARELGREDLTKEERASILEVGGRHMLEERLRHRQPLEHVLYLDSRIFLTPGAEKALLHESGLLA